MGVSKQRREQEVPRYKPLSVDGLRAGCTRLAELAEQAVRLNESTDWCRLISLAASETFEGDTPEEAFVTSMYVTANTDEFFEEAARELAIPIPRLGPTDDDAIARASVIFDVDAK